MSWFFVRCLLRETYLLSDVVNKTYISVININPSFIKFLKYQLFVVLGIGFAFV
jgi:hypothetical protein